MSCELWVVSCTELYWAALIWDALSCHVICTELYWAVLSCTELYWAVLSCAELYWAVLSCTELHWSVRNFCGPCDLYWACVLYWAVLSRIVVSFGQLYVNYRLPPTCRVLMQDLMSFPASSQSPCKVRLSILTASLLEMKLTRFSKRLGLGGDSLNTSARSFKSLRAARRLDRVDPKKEKSEMVTTNDSTTTRWSYSKLKRLRN